MADLDSHQELLLQLTSPGGDLSATGRYATSNQPRWYEAGQPLTERTGMLAALRHDFMASGAARSECRAIITSGPSGSGKSLAARTLVSQRGLKAEDFRWIDPDHFKDLLLRRAVRDGSLPWLISPDVRRLQDSGVHFPLREFGSLVHRESVILAQDSLHESFRRRDNLVYDGTLPTRVGASHAIKPLQKAGYRVTIISVECTRDEAIERTRDRWRAGRAAALREPSGSTSNRALGARFVPPDYIASLYPSDRPDRSHSADVARWAFDHYPAVTELQCYRVRDGEKAPVLERVLHKIPDGRVIDTRPSGDELPEHVRELRRAFGPQRGAVQRHTPTGTTPARPPAANRRRPNQLER